jgi:hypothetical protein
MGKNTKCHAVGNMANMGVYGTSNKNVDERIKSFKHQNL